MMKMLHFILLSLFLMFLGSSCGKDEKTVKRLAGVPGPEGDIGAPGKSGSDGVDGVDGDPGPIGNKGDKGESGNQGPIGPQGPQGPAGPAPSCPEFETAKVLICAWIDGKWQRVSLEVVVPKGSAPQSLNDAPTVSLSTFLCGGI